MQAERYVCPHDGPGVMTEGGGLSGEAAAELVEEGRLGAQDGHALPKWTSSTSAPVSAHSILPEVTVFMSVPRMSPT